MSSFIYMIEEYLEGEPVDMEYGPTDQHFAQVDKITDEYGPETICQAILEAYDPAKHDRHQVSYLFNIIIWYGPKFDMAVSRFFKKHWRTRNPKIMGFIISKHLEWFPFSTPEKTLKKVKKIKARFPQFEEDCDHWYRQSLKHIERRTGKS